ncbi:hypothetical protein CC1G_02294 [Coprinopsis cinerea okayama7|uniref:Uncharacterized protein n=1 Tax=Coprinopsis cinerea (strain Okayama-7 / 130 / ATCC MYA-4618 / FGSC 9003) TaxID=240176 RepID=A8N7N7_COPC7|nr:hypothetical protein CC1G_02294 [Coprinopsis cinerea okayama7\|eukprot:XP_001830843.1 hypothetical protein CC1G_02294 [Coprinopsis cinerea okayama7\
MFATNEPLPQDEVSRIKENIAGLTSRLSRNDQQLAILLRQVEEIRGENVRLSIEIQKQKNLISLLRSLPLELLGYIFLLASEPTTTPMRDSRDNGPHGTRIKAERVGALRVVQGDAENRREILAFSHVCRRWRRAALATPRLWRSFSLQEGASYSPRSRLMNWDRYVPRVQNWLQRAGALPKSLSISSTSYVTAIGMYCDDDNDSCGGSCPACADSVVDGIIRQLHPWKHLSLEVVTPACLEALGNRLLSTAPDAWNSIQHLSISIAKLGVPRPHARFPPVRDLKELQIAFPTDDEEANSPSFHMGFPASTLQNLTHFELTATWSFAAVAEVLRHCVNLDSFVFVWRCMDLEDVIESGSDGADTNNIGVVQLPALKTLSLTLEEERPPSLVLRSLQTSSLTHLFINLLDDGPEEDIGIVVKDFITSSNCSQSLVTFHLACENVTDDNLVQLLRLLPSLRTLRLSSMQNVVGKFLLPFYCPSDDHLPHLEALELLQMPRAFKPRYLLNFVAARGPRATYHPPDSSGRVQGITRTVLKRAVLDFAKEPCHSGVVEALNRGFELEMDKGCMPTAFYSTPEPAWVATYHRTTT